MKTCCSKTSLRYIEASIKLRLFWRIFFSTIDMATSWDQNEEQTTSVESDTTTVTADVDATAVPSVDMGNRLQNLLTMIDNSEEAGMDFMKRVESSVRLLYGEYAANSMELLCADLNAVKLGGLLVQLARENKIELLHGVDFLRILGITASPYTNFDALFADWSDDDEDNLETVCRHIYFSYGTYGEIRLPYFGHPTTTGES
jgi:hypothetical protein